MVGSQGYVQGLLGNASGALLERFGVNDFVGVRGDGHRHAGQKRNEHPAQCVFAVTIYHAVNSARFRYCSRAVHSTRRARVLFRARTNVRLHNQGRTATCTAKLAVRKLPSGATKPCTGGMANPASSDTTFSAPKWTPRTSDPWATAAASMSTADAA